MSAAGRPLPWRTSPLLGLAALALLGCGDHTRGSSTPAAMEAPRGSGSDNATSATPAAADTPAGGSSGLKGMDAVPDSSGGPSTATRPAQPGAAPSRAPSAATSTPEPGQAAPSGGFTARPGLPAEATGRMGSQGSTNSTPNSSTGNASR